MTGHHIIICVNSAMMMYIQLYKNYLRLVKLLWIYTYLVYDVHINISVLNDRTKPGFIRVRVEIPNLKAKSRGLKKIISGRKDQAQNASVTCDFEERWIFLFLFLKWIAINKYYAINLLDYFYYNYWA